jgi:hypothetical protein
VGSSAVRGKDGCLTPLACAHPLPLPSRSPLPPPPQHPRDVYLFASDVGQGQRAMLAARSGAILFRTDVCKAAVYADKAVLFPCRWVGGRRPLRPPLPSCPPPRMSRGWVVGLGHV